MGQHMSSGKGRVPGRLYAGHRNGAEVELLAVLHLPRRTLHVIVDAA